MNQQLLAALLALKQRDTDTRSRLLNEGKLYGAYTPEMQEIHRENAYELDRIVSQHGWPGISLVGLEGCRAAWLVAQHAICTPELQRKFLSLLVSASERGDVPGKQVAFLMDRIRFNENKPQVFGTVLDWNEKGELSCNVEDSTHLDARRKAVGLAPFCEDLEKHRAEIELEGGKPPQNFAEYKQQARAWALSVGWL